MFVAAFAHTYTFTHKDYISEDGSTARKPFLKAFWQSSLPDDMFADIRRTAVGRFSRQEMVSPEAIAEEQEFKL